MVRIKPDSWYIKFISDRLIVKDTAEPYTAVETQDGLYLYIPWNNLNSFVSNNSNIVKNTVWIVDGKIHKNEINLKDGNDVEVMPDTDVPTKFCKKFNCKFYVKCKVRAKPSGKLPCDGITERLPHTLTKRCEINKVDMSVISTIYHDNNDDLSNFTKDELAKEFFRLRLDINSRTSYGDTEQLLKISKDLIKNWDTLWKDIADQKEEVMKAKDELYGVRQEFCEKCEFSQLDVMGKCELGMNALNCPLKSHIDKTAEKDGAKQIFPPIIQQFYDDHEQEIKKALFFMENRWPITVTRKHHYLNYIDANNQILYTSDRTGKVQMKLTQPEYLRFMKRKSPLILKMDDIPTVAKVYAYLMTEMPDAPTNKNDIDYRTKTWFQNWGVVYPYTNGQTLGISLSEYGIVAYTVYRGNVELKEFTSKQILKQPEFLYRMPKFRKYLAEKIEQLTAGVISKSKVTKE